MKNGFEKWNNYNNKIDENDKKAKIESKIQEDIEKNKISKKELEKYSEKDLNINDDNNKPEIFEKPQEEKDINLINNADNELLIEEDKKLNKSTKDTKPLIISSNERAE